MNLSVTSRHIDVSPSLRDRTEIRLEELFSKYFGQAISANVTFDREGQKFKSRLEAHVGTDIHMNASALHEDAYTALDNAAQNLAKRLRRHKRKLRDHHQSHQDAAQRQAAQSRILELPVFDEDAPEGEDTEHTYGGVVIAESSSQVKTMSVSDAVAELDLSDEPALLFMNSKTGRSNMIYRRTDGNLGWVEPN